MGAGKESDSYVSNFIKFLMFFFNFLFWLIGAAFITVGLWAYFEKSQFEIKSPSPESETSGSSDSTSSDSSTEASKTLEIYDLVFDLTIVLIILGCVIFIISFTGYVGALRENVCLLKFFAYTLGALFIFQIILAVLAFVFSSEVKAKVVEVLRDEGLIRYRDDDDLRNFFDWIQKTFSCCGVGLDGFKDWSFNPYFNCTDQNPSIERCAVPFSCCKEPNDIEESLINTMCGFNTQGLSYPAATEIIYTTGCIQSILSIAEENLYIIGGVAIGLAIPQILGIALSCILYRDIKLEEDVNTRPYHVEPMRY